MTNAIGYTQLVHFDELIAAEAIREKQALPLMITYLTKNNLIHVPTGKYRFASRRID